MGFEDISARMKQARAKKTGAQPTTERPFDPAESYRLRSKMLGVLIRDARLSAARTTEECGRLLGLPAMTIEAWEYGEAAPDLPQLEMLAYYLDVPVSHFWGQRTMNVDRGETHRVQQEYMALRQRMVGALLRQAREREGLSVDAVAETTHLAPEQIDQYEMGEVAIPMHELTVLAGAVNRNMDYFIDGSSYIGELLQIREEWKLFTDLDEDIRAFAANPLNINFIKIAMMYSRMPTDELRKVAESLLDITM